MFATTVMLKYPYVGMHVVKRVMFRNPRRKWSTLARLERKCERHSAP